MKDDAIAPDDPSSAVERRLATILMADVFGYSRMMGEDEERTVRIFRGHRAVFDELLKSHRGRVFNTAGDAILAEFPSAVEAVRCATEIQAALRTRNEHLPEEQRMWFRIGINLGDVIIQGGDLLGDGVNIAARIQTIAEPGGVCISGSVYDQIQNKLTLQIRQLGEKSFKNIARPVRTFSISDDDSPQLAGVRWSGARRGRLAATAGIGALVAALAGGGYWLYRDSGLKAAEESQRAAEKQRKIEQDQAAAAQKEAKLLAELQGAKDALTQAEAGKRKAELDRVAVEAAQREARMQSELKATKEALAKAEQSEKDAAEARKTASVATEKSPVGAKKAAAAERRAASAEAKAAGADAKTRTQVATATDGGAAATKGAARVDGAYIGRMCSTNPDNSPRCWGVTLTVQHGTISASWLNRFNNLQSHANGTIASDGTVKLALDGYAMGGRALTGTAEGTLSGNKVTVAGHWSNNAPISGTWSFTQ
jgi:class 3 adenylate cyclase